MECLRDRRAMRRRDVKFHSAAAGDLDDLAGRIIETSGLITATEYLTSIEDACFDLAVFPLRGTQREDLGAGIRTLGLRRRVTIVFRVTISRAEILRVLYGGRDLERALDNLPDDV